MHRNREIAIELLYICLNLVLYQHTNTQAHILKNHTVKIT